MSTDEIVDRPPPRGCLYDNTRPRTAHDVDQAERARRVEIYRAGFELHGRITFMPPKGGAKLR